MQKITPNLWFDGTAREAVEFYTSVFPEGKITGGSTYPTSTEEGLADFQVGLAGEDLTVDFELEGLRFTAINAGPEFRPTPANSFFVNFDPLHNDHAREQLDALWATLTDSGNILMALGEYPFSPHYGWVEDKFGYSWQLILTNPEGEPRPRIIPSLMFTDPEKGQAEDALRYYASVFADSTLGTMAKRPEGQEPVGSLLFGEASLSGQWFSAMDSGPGHDFACNEAVSYSVICKDQAEIDYFWDRLSAHPENEQCGWCKDKFGVSWQIVPAEMDALMQKPGAFQTMMNQHKIIVDEY